ncbi:hypothetical protein AKJ16_DCAP06271 [Drosera capensis]
MAQAENSRLARGLPLFFSSGNGVPPPSWLFNRICRKLRAEIILRINSGHLGFPCRSEARGTWP